MPLDYDRVGLLASIYDFLSTKVNYYHNRSLLLELVEYFEFFRKDPPPSTTEEEYDNYVKNYDNYLIRLDEISDIIRKQLIGYVNDAYTNDEYQHMFRDERSLPPLPSTHEVVRPIMNGTIDKEREWISSEDIENFFYDVYGHLNFY